MCESILAPGSSFAIPEEAVAASPVSFELKFADFQ